MASAVYDCGIMECGALPSPVFVRKFRLYWIGLEPRARHTCEEFLKGVPFVSHGLPISSFTLQSSNPSNNTDTLQVSGRTSLSL